MDTDLMVESGLGLDSDEFEPDDLRVDETAPEYERRIDIPEFEGKVVTQTKAKLTSVSALEVEDRVWRMDEYIRLSVECRVVAVDHKVNQTTGDLERIHLLKAVDAKVLPWSG